MRIVIRAARSGHGIDGLTKRRSDPRPTDGDIKEVTEYVGKRLNGREDDQGAVEDAQSCVDNVSDAFARLVDTLAENGHLCADDITEICGDYLPWPAELIRGGGAPDDD